MKKFALLIVILCFSIIAKAQKLSFEQLENMLNSSIDEAEENLFLMGYPFLSKSVLPDSAGIIYNFSNRKNTISTAKKVTKEVYYKKPGKSKMQYITYERAEFQRFRRLMIEEQFIRNGKGSLSENASYSKKTLKVNFEVKTDDHENKLYCITLEGARNIAAAIIPKRIDLKTIFKK